MKRRNKGGKKHDANGLSPWPWVPRRITAAKESRQSWNYCVFLDHVQTPTTNSRVIIATHSTMLAYIDMKRKAHLIFRSIDSFHVFVIHFILINATKNMALTHLKIGRTIGWNRIKSSEKDWIASITTYSG